MPYCSKCGARIEEDSVFCEICGAKQKQYSARFPYEKDQKNKPYLDPDPHKTKSQFTQPTIYNVPHRKNSSLPLLIIFSVSIIIIIIVGGLLGILYFSGPFNSSYYYLGDQPEVILPFDNNISSLQLELDTNVGDIEIFTENNVDFLFRGRVEVYGRKDTNIEDASIISYKNESSKIIAQFSSDWNHDTNNRFYYNLAIFVAKEISVEIDVRTNTGNILIDLAQLNINSFHLATNTGNQIIELNNINHFNVNEASMVANTGNIILSLAGINYTTLYTTWTLEANTGSLEVTLNQQIGDIEEKTKRNFIINSITGNIHINANLAFHYGIYVVTSTIGSILLPNGDKTFSTPSYYTADWKYDFNLSTSTGNIFFE